MFKKYIMVVVFFSLLSNSYGSVKKLELQGVKYGTQREKLSSLEKLININNKIYLPQIAEFLNDPSDEVRSKAVYALLVIGDSTCLPYFKKALQDSWWQVRLYAIKGIVKYGEGNVLIEFLKSLDDSYWQVRYYGAIGLGKYGDENVMENLINHLGDKNIKVQEEILWALNRLMWRNEARAKFKKLSKNTISPLVEKLKSKETSIKIRTIWVLESTGDKRSIPYLIKTLTDKDPEVKIRVVWALENLKATEAEDAIEGELEGDSLQVKLESIKTLVRLKSRDTVNGLVRRLKDRDEKIRIYALWALERFNQSSTYPAIVKTLTDPSQSVREYAVKLIENIRSPEFYPLLEDLVTSDDVAIKVKILSLSILGRIGDKSIDGFLLGIAKGDNFQLRKSAIENLFLVDTFDNDSLRLLCYMESFDENLSVRKKASILLKKIMQKLFDEMDSSEKEKRINALEKLEVLEGSKNFKFLLMVIAKSEYPEVREKMAFFAQKKPNLYIIEDLRKIFQEPNIIAKKYSALALGTIKDRNSIELLKEGLKSFDPELQINCAWALAKMRLKDGFPIAVNFLRSNNPELQKKSAEVFAFLKDKRASDVLLKSLSNSELDVKVVCAWALARMGEMKGLEVLVKLSGENIEPVRTIANEYLEDPGIPVFLKNEIAYLREGFYREKMGIQEVSPKIMRAFRSSSPIQIDGKNNDRFWKIVEEENKFLIVEGDKSQADIQTKVAVGYDEENLYFLIICDDPDTSSLHLTSRDFITICLNPENSFEKWYQFVVHPFNHIRYCYVWKFYGNEKPEKVWDSLWKSETIIGSGNWMVEISIPLSDIGVDKIIPGSKWNVNFQRESENNFLTTTWTGRIDNPEQFGDMIFTK